MKPIPRLVLAMGFVVLASCGERPTRSTAPAPPPPSFVPADANVLLRFELARLRRLPIAAE